MKKSLSLLSVLLGLVFLLGNFSPAFAIPPLPAGFYGTLKINGANVPVGLPVTAWIGGVPYATAYAASYLENTVFTLSVPGDDPSTPAKEGGIQGETIEFKIGGISASPTAPWSSGTNVELNLSATGVYIYLPLIAR